MGDDIFQFRFTQSSEEIKEKRFIVEFLSVPVPVQDKIETIKKYSNFVGSYWTRKWFPLQPWLRTRISLQTWPISP